LNIPFSRCAFTVFFEVRPRLAEPANFPKKAEQKAGRENIPIGVMPPMDPIANSTAAQRLTSAAGAAAIKQSENERTVMELFEQFRNPLLRYAVSFGVPAHDAEEIIQEVFLALFRHVQSGGSRKNLRGWIFRVAHNLALKRRSGNQRLQIAPGEAIADEQPDPAPNPEEQVSTAQRRRRLLAVVDALPVADQGCLRLRAEGLRYREIASVLGMSLGAVSISLTRSLARLIRADSRE
jgi:RNA polymerase sigma-70 factor, ECF subfamily